MSALFEWYVSIQSFCEKKKTCIACKSSSCVWLADQNALRIRNRLSENEKVIRMYAEMDRRGF